MKATKKKTPHRKGTRANKGPMIPAQTAEEAAAFHAAVADIHRQLKPSVAPLPRPSNKLAAMVWAASEKIQQGRVILPGGHGISEKGYATIFQDVDGLRKQLGAAILDAFIRGDRNFADEILKAFKQIAALFHREQNQDILERLMPHIPRITAACRTKAERRKAVDAVLGKNRKLYNEEWHRIQTAMHWTRIPKGKAIKSHKRD